MIHKVFDISTVLVEDFLPFDSSYCHDFFRDVLCGTDLFREGRDGLSYMDLWPGRFAQESWELRKNPIPSMGRFVYFLTFTIKDQPFM